MISSPKRSSYFLSVIMRTQGSRILELQDAFLSLAGQSNQNFEVILVTHSPIVPPEVIQIVESQPKYLRSKTTLLNVSGGKRGVPLNIGIAHAKGDYFSFFDDDDILLPNWVAEFETFATKYPGKLLRAQTAVQSFVSSNWEGTSELGYSPLAAPEIRFPSKFNQVEHVRVNQTPFMSLAFPSNVFRLNGFRFDEQLDVCEDWDLILTASSLMEVIDIPATTSIYRHWRDRPSSYIVHNEAMWKKAEDHVITRLSQQSMTLWPGSVSELHKQLELAHAYKEIETLAIALTSFRKTWIYTLASWSSRNIFLRFRKINRNANKS